MPLNLQEISDRIEINDLLIRYCTAIDDKDWTLLDTCFLPDADVDYASSGGIAGKYPEARAWLEKALAPFPMTVHAISNSVIELDGDRARGKTVVINPMGFEQADGSLHQFTVGAYYVDELARTPGGWRIAKRVEQQVYLDGSLPKALAIPS